MSRYERHKPIPKTLGTLNSGEVVFDRPSIHNHLDGELLGEALGLIALEGDYSVESVDMGRVIGLARCVETTAEDTIIFAHRKGREGPSRFVLGRDPEPTTFATVILLRDKIRAETAILITAWSGPRAEAEPWDRIHTEETRKASQLFWAGHALINAMNEIDFTRSRGITPNYLRAKGFLLEDF